MDEGLKVASKANVALSVFAHLKANRIEYAVFTLLIYSIGALDKAISYGQSICV